MLSTGMSTEAEVRSAFENLSQDFSYTIFHCNASYPTDDSEINLNAMASLKSLMGLWHGYNKITIGFSSHSPSPFPCIGAMYMGAEFIEVHYTLDRAMQGTDQAASLELNALELLVREAKRMSVIMGDGDIQLYDSELSAREKLRGS